MKYGSFIKSFFVILFSIGVLSTNAFAETPPSANQPTYNPNAKKAGEEFLLANKTKSGVVTLPDGLQYKIITEGSGQHPTDTDLVTVHYSGELVDGTEFDSSYKRGEPATFPVSGVIPGWTEALKLMNKGSTWELYIPASLAYGAQGAPPVIGPNETLIFKVNLIDIKKQ
jgi:FKBP-type peptidyl-prolyl cis-trans isomerase FklB